MPLKINIAEKHGKTYHIDLESENLFGKQISDRIKGNEISPELSGYELEITGASDKAGFPALGDFETLGLKGVLMGYGKGMHRRSRREGKRKRSNFTPNGLRLRRKVRGKILSPEIAQIN
ncbi:MAG: S6e family ribosomal protein, partial [Nanoarchaeota archaeon]